MIENKLESLEFLPKIKWKGKTYRFSPKKFLETAKKVVKGAVLARLAVGTVVIGSRVFPMIAGGYILYKIGDKIFRAKSKKEIPPNAEPLTKEDMNKPQDIHEPSKEMPTVKKPILRSPFIYIGAGAVVLLIMILLLTGKKKKRRR